MVTIVVLIILSAVAIGLSLGDNGIITSAKEATDGWKQSSESEQEGLKQIANLIKSNGNSNGGSGNEEVKKLQDITGNEIENTITQDKFGNKIIIPAGFKVINPEDDVRKGIVIEDVSAKGATEHTKGSQFVWIPVGEIYTDVKQMVENKKTITLGRYIFNSAGSPTAISDNYKEYTNENYDSDYENVIAKDIEDFIKKATLSHGYYIGRYELGDATAKNYERKGTNDKSDRSDPVACKKDIYPYTYINQADASSLCQEMYNSKQFECDLINSYAWDTAIVFIQSFSGDSNYSRQSSKGGFDVEKCGNSYLLNVDPGNIKQEVRCNIFDMAGNTYEWSTETYCFGVNNCISRGGCYYIDDACTSNRNASDTIYTGGNMSARPIIYL